MPKPKNLPAALAPVAPVTGDNPFVCVPFSDLPKFGITWCRSHIARAIKSGVLPEPVVLGPRTRGFVLAELQAHLRRLAEARFSPEAAVAREILSEKMAALAKQRHNPGRPRKDGKPKRLRNWPKPRRGARANSKARQSNTAATQN